MTQEQQQKAFAIDLGALIDRYADQFDLTHESIVGALELQKFSILQDAFKDDDQSEPKLD